VFPILIFRTKVALSPELLVRPTRLILDCAAKWHP
jgi:hypothetical protein